MTPGEAFEKQRKILHAIAVEEWESDSEAERELEELEREYEPDPFDDYGVCETGF